MTVKVEFFTEKRANLSGYTLRILDEKSNEIDRIDVTDKFDKAKDKKFEKLFDEYKTELSESCEILYSAKLTSKLPTSITQYSVEVYASIDGEDTLIAQDNGRSKETVIEIKRFETSSYSLGIDEPYNGGYFNTNEGILITGWFYASEGDLEKLLKNNSGDMKLYLLIEATNGTSQYYHVLNYDTNSFELVYRDVSDLITETVSIRGDDRKAGFYIWIRSPLEYMNGRIKVKLSVNPASGSSKEITLNVSPTNPKINIPEVINKITSQWR